MSTPVSPIPDGFRTITPSIIVKDPDAAIELYKKAFGAEDVMVLRAPGGAVMHAELRIGDSVLMLGGEWPDHGMKAPAEGHYSGGIHLYVADADKAFQRAIDAGCEVVMPPCDMFWGDRYAKVKDTSGHHWGLATHVEDVPPDECERRAAAWKPDSCS